jgi:hypothetical protein
MKRRDFCRQSLLMIAIGDVPTSPRRLEGLRQRMHSPDFATSYQVVCQCRKDSDLALALLPELMEVVLSHETTKWMAAAKAIGNLGEQARHWLGAFRQIQERGDLLDQVVVAEARLKIDLAEAESVSDIFGVGLFVESTAAPTRWILNHLSEEARLALKRHSLCPWEFGLSADEGLHQP